MNSRSSCSRVSDRLLNSAFMRDVMRHGPLGGSRHELVDIRAGLDFLPAVHALEEVADLLLREFLSVFVHKPSLSLLVVGSWVSADQLPAIDSVTSASPSPKAASSESAVAPSMWPSGV